MYTEEHHKGRKVYQVGVADDLELLLGGGVVGVLVRVVIAGLD